MPRSFLIKKKGKSEKKIDDIIRAFTRKECDIGDNRPVVTEPLVSAVAPFTPALVQPIQPLAVRLCNGYIQDVLSTFPYFEPRAYTTSPVKHESPGREPSVFREPSLAGYRESLNREAREALARETIARETIARETIARETIARETIARETIARETIARETLARESLARESLAREPSFRDSFNREKTFRETPPIVEKREIPSPTSSTISSGSEKSSTPSSGGRKQTGFQDGITVGYTCDAFFVSDGRSRKRNPLGLPDTNRQRYTCNECGKNYATSSNLSRHKQTHRSLDSQQAKKCHHCGKVYVSMPALSMHILTHNLKHECKVCGKAFSRPWLLQGHMRSHSGEKPYGCAHCGKAFADRSNLRAHMQTHSAFKHYKCKRCNKSFALKSYLNKHYESACIKEEGIIDVVA